MKVKSKKFLDIKEKIKIVEILILNRLL